MAAASLLVHLVRLLELELTIVNAGRLACLALLFFVTAGCGTGGVDVIEGTAGAPAGDVSSSESKPSMDPGAKSEMASGMLDNLVVPGGVPVSQLSTARPGELALRGPLRDPGSDNSFQPLKDPASLPLQAPSRALEVFEARVNGSVNSPTAAASVFLASFTNEVMGSDGQLDFVEVPAYVFVVDDLPGFGRKIGGVNPGNYRQPTDCRSFTIVDAVTADLLTTETYCK